jgi:hypothetical protein
MLAPGLCFLVALFITSVCRLQVREISEISRAPGSPLASDQVIAFETGQIARDADVASLVLTHIPPYLDKSVSVAEAESTFGKAVRLAVPGTEFRV